MLSRAYTSFLLRYELNPEVNGNYRVNALTGLYLISTRWKTMQKFLPLQGVSMPSRASTSLLLLPSLTSEKDRKLRCQCPHGLVPHCYTTHTEFKDVNRTMCQCPHGLVPHCYYRDGYYVVGNAGECQCPHGLVPHCYTVEKRMQSILNSWCQCPHGLVPHCYYGPSLRS